MKFLKQATYISNSKTTKTCPNQLADLLRFLFTEHSLKIKLKLFKTSFTKSFDKNFLFLYYINWPNFTVFTVFTFQVIFAFHVWEFDDAMTFEYLKN